ncbi:4Fe-4S binding protein [Desulfosarcina sp. BuS5]|uniref:4Fe-4S binding protein n=1 Tax=Desulfosarcina sp. BuS5 TaxID=933262 RepID=UPI000A076C95
MAIFGLILFMSLKCGRLYCNTICPVGTFLGFLSRYSLFKIKLNPSECITSARHVKKYAKPVVLICIMKGLIFQGVWPVTIKYALDNTIFICTTICTGGALWKL